MADESNPDYSGGHWEAMKPDGSPFTHDTSLNHGWSTWPVYLLPRYLGGVSPLEPGWSRWKCQPVLANLTSIFTSVSTSVGDIQVSLEVSIHEGIGSLAVLIPTGSVAEIFPPKGWWILNSSPPGLSKCQTITGKSQTVAIILTRK